MSACLCTGEGDRFCAEHHAYWSGPTRVPSVTQIVKSVVTPLITKGPPPPPDRVEYARQRGVYIDERVSEYIQTGTATVGGAGIPQDWKDRFERFAQWWDKLTADDGPYPPHACRVQTQRVLIAGPGDYPGWGGMPDIVIEPVDNHCIPAVFDLKCTYNAHDDWEWQLGGYELLRYPFPWAGYDESHEQAALKVVHLMKDKLVVIPYDTNRAVRRFVAALEHYAEVQPWLNS